MFKEYFIEDGKEVDLNSLVAGSMNLKDYSLAHRSLPIPCHDVFIVLNEGILLVNRDNHPAKGEMWPIGGRIQRGASTEDSLKEKVLGECGLKIGNLEFVGMARHFFKSDPFGHGKGVDTPCLVYYAEGEGEINLDSLHTTPQIVKPQDYTAEFRESLHPYVRDFMDICMEKLRNEKN